MKKDLKPPTVFNSITELHRFLELPKPQHPLISLVDYKDIQINTDEVARALIMNFYKISFKNNFKGKVRYGQNYYDFDEGGLCFTSPNQLISEAKPERNYSGFTLLIHADFIRNYPLGKTIKDYGFFSYSATEALHLSEGEKDRIVAIFKHIQQELAAPIDNFSQNVLIAHLELLLSYSDRFYNRQFITRKTAHSDLLDQFEELLQAHFNGEKALLTGLPTVQAISDQLNVSPRYLSDMLRSLTGQNTQQHIHARLIEKAKEVLSTSNLSVAQIAYQLGFEHPQSFNKLFKQKTAVSPIEFRQSFN